MYGLSADDIVDIKSVAAGTADGAFYNNGQSCCSVERIYVHESIYDKYVEEFIVSVIEVEFESMTYVVTNNSVIYSVKSAFISLCGSTIDIHEKEK